MNKKKKKASRHMMQSRTGKRKYAQAEAYFKQANGERIPANRPAKIADAARRKGAYGRSVVQEAKQKRKARVVAARHKANKEQAAQRATNRLHA